MTHITSDFIDSISVNTSLSGLNLTLSIPRTLNERKKKEIEVRMVINRVGESRSRNL